MRRAALFALVLSPLLLAAACGGDDSSGITVSTIRTSPTQRPAASRVTGTPIVSEKTPEKQAPTAEPSEAPTPTPGPPTERPTPAAIGIPAVAPADSAAFLAQFQGKTVVAEPCIYNPANVTTNCPGRGLYAIDPPITGQDITCSLLVVDGTPRAIQCQSQEPLQTKIYEIK